MFSLARSGLLVWMAGCSGAATEPGPATSQASPEELAEEVIAPGPHAVGYRTVEVGWSDDLVTCGQERLLRVSVWYPTDAESGDPVLYQDLFPKENVFGNAPILNGPHPVAVFSHGHAAYGEAAGFLMEHLASHGWVVVAPDHLNNLTWDGAERLTEIYLQRPLDVSAVLDWLDAPGADPLAGQLGPERLGIGHSFGGYTAHAVGGASYSEDAIGGCDDGSPFCSTMTPELAQRLREGFLDARFGALVAMAPGDWDLFRSGLADIDVPEMVMLGGLDGSPADDTNPVWTDLDGAGDVLATFPLLGHNGFTDFAGVLDPEGVLDAELGWRSVRAIVLAFGRSTVGGEDSYRVLLDEASPLSDEVVSLQVR
jgi:predicted dienelactone hydrolase